MVVSKYFTYHEDYFWEWNGADEVISIPNGRTIGYSDFIFELLEHLSIQGIPPFGSFLLTVLATNSQGRQNIEQAFAEMKGLSNAPKIVELLPAKDFLKNLSDLDAKFRQGKHRIILLQSIFQNCHNGLGVEKSKKIIAHFRNARKNKLKIFTKDKYIDKVLIRDLRTLAQLHKRFPTKDAIIKNLASIPDLPAELFSQEEDLITEEPIDFIQTLMDNPKTFHVAALVKRIWSGLNIPFHSNVPSKQPFGGVADITNKGEFDKLLISEFANDNTVFMSRLANNEALFFNREIPPADNNLQRIILIDVSLKNWGNIRTLAFASLLAMANHPKTDIEHLAFLVGDQYHPIAIDSIDALINALQILETGLHAAEGLATFFTEQNLSKAEVIFITNEETLAYPTLQKVLTENNSPINYWIHPTVEGELKVYKKRSNSKKYVQTIRLPLEQLWKKDKKTKVVAELPEQEFDFPILFPEYSGNVRAVFYKDQATFVITKEKSILKRYQSSISRWQKGWELFYTDLEYYPREFAFGENENDEFVLFSYSHQLRAAYLINLQKEKSIKELSLENAPSHDRYLIFLDGQFVLFNKLGSCHIDMEGNVRKNVRPIQEILTEYASSQKKLTAAQTTHVPRSQVLKNVNRIYINESGELIFNTHALGWSTNTQLRLRKAKTRASKQGAHFKAKGHFSFPDGSEVRCYREGVIVLRSSNENLPAIYVPSVLDKDLGVSTDLEFAGNPYFYKNEQYTIRFKDSIDNKLDAIKVIKKIITNMGLEEVHKLVDAAPGLLIRETTIAMARQLQLALADIGIEVEKKRTGGEQRQIPMKDFYNKYIKTFVEQIELHAT